MSIIRTVVEFLNSIPNRVFKLTPESPHYMWYREAWHAGTALVAGFTMYLFRLISPLAYFIASLCMGIIIAAVVISKEIDEDNRTQDRSKTVIDTYTWIVFYTIPTLIGLLLFRK